MNCSTHTLGDDSCFALHAAQRFDITNISQNVLPLAKIHSPPGTLLDIRCKIKKNVNVLHKRTQHLEKIYFGSAKTIHNEVKMYGCPLQQLMKSQIFSNLNKVWFNIMHYSFKRAE